MALRLLAVLAVARSLVPPSPRVPRAAPPRRLSVARRAQFDEAATFEGLRADLDAFTREREWSAFHTPRSLALALVGEVGELCECVQWAGDADAPPGLAGWTPERRAAWEDELADVLSYVIRLADVTDVDLPTALRRKMVGNAAKYPADRVRGSAAKYTEYRRNACLLYTSPSPRDS